MTKRPAAFLFVAFVLCTASSAFAQQNLVVNDSFRTVDAHGQLTGWQPFWSRAEGAGSMAVEPGAGRSGGAALRIEHTGKEDWSVGQSAYIPVHSGDILTISGWVKSDSQGDADISVVTRDAAGKTLDWSYGSNSVGGKHDWVNFHRKLVVPDGCATVQYRLTGYGGTKLWFDNPLLIRDGSLAALTGRPAGSVQRPIEFSNKTLRVQCNAENGALSVTDTRNNLTWQQQPLYRDVLVVRAEKLDSRTVRLQALYLPSDGKLTVTYTAAADRPEIAVELSGNCTLSDSVPFPHPFGNLQTKSWLVIPMNEGVLYPVGDTTVPTTRLIAYGGHGICMPWFGQISGKSPDPANASGVMTLFNTPDDASVEIGRPDEDKLLIPRPLWDASRGGLGYARKLTYLFTDGGGYVAQAKRYRQYAITTGLFKTLAQKRIENPNVDMLIGAVNVWAFGFDKLKLCSEMKSLGMDRVLWSGDGTPTEIDAINKLGYLTSRYDIYQDVWPPNAPAGLKKAGWPEDLVWLQNGGWMHGWADIQKHSDGTQTVYQGGVISSPRGLKRAEEEIPADLKTHDYRCRFIDTTTASPFREDYNPAHPLTRSEDRKYKMSLLDFCSRVEKLVVGTETGIDPSVPYVDYYEGMLSLGPFRLPDAGYDIMGYRKPTPEFLKFMVGPVYRIPLWELVYHECVVAQWYWGDSSNKAPEVWDKRDLINILYATPPLFMMNRDIWTAHRDRFVSSYKSVCGVARRFGYDEMLSHHFLTADHTVQSTTWKSGSQILVNMGETNYNLADGTTLKAGGWLVQNKPAK